LISVQAKVGRARVNIPSPERLVVVSSAWSSVNSRIEYEAMPIFN
jgi:hypothetical protein